MRIKDFEQAIAGSGIELLRMQLRETQVEACYGQVYATETYVKWDAHGRAYVFTQSEDHESCVSLYNLEFLPYERDAKFDLVFD